MLLYAHCMIANDISSDSNAFLSAEKLIACLIFSSITLDHCILSFNSNSSLIWIFEDDEYIAFRNVLHFSLNSIFNSFCKFCIENSFSIKHDLMNLYVWNTFFFDVVKKIDSELGFNQLYCIMIWISHLHYLCSCIIISASFSDFLFWWQRLLHFDELIVSSEFWFYAYSLFKYK